MNNKVYPPPEQVHNISECNFEAKGNIPTLADDSQKLS